MRLIKVLKTLVTLCLAGLIGLIAAVGLVPDQTGLLVGNLILKPSGYSVIEIQGLEVKLSELSFENLIIQSSQGTASLSNGSVSYNQASLSQGQVRDITVNKAILNPANNTHLSPSTSSNSSAENISLLLTQLSALPFQLLSINSGQLTIPDQQIEGNLEVRSNPFSLSLKSRSIGDSFTLEASLTQEADNKFTGKGLILMEGEPGLTTEATINILEQSLLFSTENSLHIPTLSDQLQAHDDMFQLTSTLDSLLLKADIEYSFATDQSAAVEVTIGDITDEISLAINDIGSLYSITPTLPISLKGNYKFEEPVLQLSIDNMSIAMSGDDSASTTVANGSFQNNYLRCNAFTDCEFGSSLAISANLINSNQIRIEEMLSSASLQGQWSSSAISLHSDQISLSVPAAKSDEFSTSLEFEFNDFSVTQNFEDELLSLESQFLLDRLALDSRIGSFDNFTASGNLSLSGDKLVASSDFTLQNQLTGSLSADHQFSNGDGTGLLIVDDYRFSEITPLSDLVSNHVISADVVSGMVSADARVDWQFRDTDPVTMSGPISIHISEIGGYYEDVFFVGLNTSVDLEITEAGAMRSLTPLTGSLTTVDPGIPIQDISWGYTVDYDLASSLNGKTDLLLHNLSGTLLGGELSVPRVNLGVFPKQTDFDVVISNLDLHAIVALAEYPELAVDGLISGYLPVTLGSTGVTINQGLISALNPGGTIRYTPGTGPSTNPSVQLVNDALSNYQYDTLDTRVVYQENGDLDLAVQLQGINPDMNQGQAINLNVNVSDNVLSLLESLQASRSITDALEESLNERQQTAN